MLILERKRDERIDILGGLITIVVVDIRGDKVRLGVEAPRDISVVRDDAKRRERRDAEL